MAIIFAIFVNQCEIWLHVSNEISYYEVNSPFQQSRCGYFKSVTLSVYGTRKKKTSGIWLIMSDLPDTCSHTLISAAARSKAASVVCCQVKVCASG